MKVHSSAPLPEDEKVDVCNSDPNGLGSASRQCGRGTIASPQVTVIVNDTKVPKGDREMYRVSPGFNHVGFIRAWNVQGSCMVSNRRYLTVCPDSF